MNIHAPERQPNETMVGYKERRLVSKKIYQESQRGVRLAPFAEETLFVKRHRAPAACQERRDLVRLMGVRQYKKMKRAAV